MPVLVRVASLPGGVPNQNSDPSRLAGCCYTRTMESAWLRRDRIDKLRTDLIDSDGPVP